MAARPAFWPRLDDSHQPFKRVKTLQEGPRGRRTVVEQKRWECHKANKYVQYCVDVGADAQTRGTLRKVRTDPAWKRRYNKEYAKWRGKHGARGVLNKAQPAYRRREPGAKGMSRAYMRGLNRRRSR